MDEDPDRPAELVEFLREMAIEDAEAARAMSIEPGDDIALMGAMKERARERLRSRNIRRYLDGATDEERARIVELQAMDRETGGDEAGVYFFGTVVKRQGGTVEPPDGA